jgi:uncharacterized protein (TIGR02266 family)
VSPTDLSSPKGPFDQREGRRLPLRRRVSLKFKDFQGFVNEYLENISAGGMFIRTTVPPPVGTVFDFELTLEDYSRLVHGLGEVVWVRERDEGFDRPAGMGVRFLSLEPESRELIERLLALGVGARTMMGAALAAPDLDAEAPWWAEGPAPEAEPELGPEPGPELEPELAPELGPEVEPEGGPDPGPEADPEPEPAGAGEPPGVEAPAEAPAARAETPAAPPIPPPSPYAYARSYRGSGIARESRRPRPLLLILLIVVVLVALAAAGLLLFPEVVDRWLLGDETRAELEEPAGGAAGRERTRVAGEPIIPVAPSEAVEPLAPPEEAAGAGAPEREGEEDPGEPEMGFFEPAPGPEPAPPPAPAQAAKVAEPPPAPNGAERGFSRVLNVIWEPAGEGLTVTVFLDGPVQEWNYSVDRLETPPRVVVRVQGVDRPFPRSAIPIGTELVERIRLGFHPERGESELHLVLDLATLEAEVRTEAAGSEIRLHVARDG